MNTNSLRILAILLAVLTLSASLFGCSRDKAPGGEADTNTAEATVEPAGSTSEAETIDYLVLVNKQNALPDNWESIVQLEEATNRWGETYQVEKTALAAFFDLQKDLLDNDGIVIELDSTYRSVKRQKEIWSEFEAEKGIDYAREYVAVPGYSEHHTGLAIDICIEKDGVRIDDNDDMIAEREIFAQIHKKLASHGFILRYLEGMDAITGYAYEPWHFRYVGVKAAEEIMNAGITLEEYLGKAPATEPESASAA